MKQQAERAENNQTAIAIDPTAWRAFKREPRRAIKQLRKLKARAMVDALEHGNFEQGNHRINYMSSEDRFTFFYRGTCIVSWVIHGNGTSTLEMVDAGAYEHTVSTLQQRREIQRAISMIKEVYHL